MGYLTYIHFFMKNGHMNKGKWMKVNLPIQCSIWERPPPLKKTGKPRFDQKFGEKNVQTRGFLRFMSYHTYIIHIIHILSYIYKLYIYIIYISYIYISYISQISYIYIYQDLPVGMPLKP